MSDFLAPVGETARGVVLVGSPRAGAAALLLDPQLERAARAERAGRSVWIERLVRVTRPVHRLDLLGAEPHDCDRGIAQDHREKPARLSRPAFRRWIIAPEMAGRADCGSLGFEQPFGERTDGVLR